MTGKYEIEEIYGQPGELPIIARNKETGEERKYFQILGYRDRPPCIYDPIDKEFYTYGHEVFDAVMEWHEKLRRAKEFRERVDLAKKYKGRMPK